MTVRLTSEVQSVVYSNPSNGWTVARVRAEGQPGLVSIVGVLGTISPGEALTLEGEWAEHPKFGRQFQVKTFEHTRPATEQGVVKFLSSSAIKGVGEKTAQRLVERFGVEVLDLLDQAPERLLEVKGISRRKLKDILKSWGEQREIKNLILFLHEHGVPPTFAGRIFHLYGAQSVRTLTENPYNLAYEIRGVGFRTADSMALKIGFPEDSPQRLQAALLWVLFSQSERSGHLFLPRPTLVAEACRILPGVDPERIDEGVDALELIKRIRMDALPRLGVDQAIFLTHYYRYEQEIAQRLFGLAQHAMPGVREKVLAVLPSVEAEVGINLVEGQREAVLGACVNKLFVITGGPGTGKTTITKVVVRTLMKLGLKLKLAAPTGRAAKRLSEATDRPAQTLHRLLQYQPDGGFLYGEDKKLGVEALIVDEASMLDAHLFVSLLKALPMTTRLILVGDVNQLPSVGPGNVLGDILNSGAVPSVVLRHIFRQAQESFIVVNAHRINAGQFPRQSPYPPPQADFYWISQDDSERVQSIIVETVCDRIPERYGLDPMRDVQVLTPMHKGEVGTQALNQLLQARLNPRPARGRCVEIKRGSVAFRVGDRVLQLRNNYDKEVFNGDLGWVEELDADSGELAVRFDSGVVHLEATELDDLTLAYAVSVHKSQGSEYPAVIIPVVTQHYMLLQRNLLYTALTRARRLAIMVGSERAFNIGLRNVTAGRRYTALAERLRTSFAAAF